MFKNYKKDSVTSAIHYRGPDEHTWHDGKSMFFLFDRLSINGVNNGSQPFVAENQSMICNGEIYNHERLKSESNVETTTESDCEVVFRMINAKTEDLGTIFNKIDGVFALIYESAEEIIVARDPIGIRPLYIAYKDDDIVGFSSEAKGLVSMVEPGIITKVVHFPPGHYWSSETRTFTRYTQVELKRYDEIDSWCSDDVVQNVHDLLFDAVSKRLMSDRPVAFFLSGGLDSSIIAAIGAKIMHPQRITVFSIGTSENSPDVANARIVAKHLNAIHHVFDFEPKDAFEQIEQTIWHLESYDCTTVRASVPMFMLSKYISENFDFKVILSGEGADELFGGYLYLHNAPDEAAFHDETINLIKNVHQFDALRADRCTAGNGLELRVPFFDLKLVNYVTNLHPELKMPFESCELDHKMEKLVLRLAFSDYLPAKIIMRQKNGMSDAVGYSWVDFVKQHATTKLENNKIREFDIQHNTPLSSEEHLYRCLFHEMFQNLDIVSHDSIWRPKWTDVVDPSARQLQNLFSE